jgi:prepilin-type processing-associated H-X9-DG protein
MKSARHSGAFSLLELLVVLATIALLMGVLLPSLSAVKASGRSAVCVSNLRQMAVAARQYALAHQYFPPAIRYEPGGVQVAWDWVTTMGGELISPGPLWAFSDDPRRVQQCPAYHGATNFAGDPHTGYNYNATYLGGEGRWPSMGWDGFHAGARYSACRRTSTVAAFGDGGWAGGANKFMRSPLSGRVRSFLSPPEIYAGGQAFRHRHRTNVAYIDGHVSGVGDPCRGAPATESLLHEKMDYPRNGFLSDDDRAYDPR